MTTPLTDWFNTFNTRLENCHQCARLVQWREQVATEKIKRHQTECYWGKAAPSFGDPRAQLLIIGLAPAAHGANRTGRMFTGDRSGDWLYRALHKAGFANQAHSTHKEDGLRLINCYITAVAHCAPPLNKLEKSEIHACQPYLEEEWETLPNIQVCVALGQLAFSEVFKMAFRIQQLKIPTIPKFSHGIQAKLPNHRLLIGSYHPSQQNTFTGKLTEPMFDSIFDTVNTSIQNTAV